MSKYNTLTKLFFTGLTAILLTACGGNSTTSYNTATGETLELGVDNPVCQEGSSTYEGKVQDSNTKKALKNVDIIIDGCRTKTDKNGYYKLSNILSQKRTSVTFKKDSYYHNSEIIYNNKSTSNYLEFSFDAYKSGEEINFNSKSGTSRDTIEISDTVVYRNIETNEKYSGQIKSNLFYKNTYNSKNKEFFPGTYQGIDSNGIIVPFVSYGFIVIEFNDKNNNELNISESIISFKVKNLKGTQDEIIPLWYYNYDRGIWIEKGFAHRDDNGNYICEITQAGAWSLSKPIETEMGIYKGYIVDENENPITNVRIKATGKNWVNQDLTTDENGVFKIYVVPNQTFTLSAYDYKEQYGAYFPGTISKIASGAVVEE